MKTVFHILNDVGEKLIEHIHNKVVQHEAFGIRELMACFTTDVISSCVFGLEGNCIENKNSEFRRIGRKAIHFSKLKNMAVGLATTFREQARKLKFKTFDNDATIFFYQIVRQVINYRQTNKLKRNDLMQIMIEMMKTESSDGLTLDDVVGNAFVFFFAGFETSSTTLTFALHLLAQHKDVQEKARNEIDKIFERNEKLTYDKLNDLHFLEQIIQESLRIFPVVGVLNRISNEPFTLPNGSIIPKGTMLIVPILGFHFDENLWPQPEKFIPDRFTQEEIQKRHHFSYLPFGEGQRICIGQRFAMMQMKVGLVNILRNFNVNVTSKTEIPIQIDNAQAVYVPQGKVWLNLSKR